MGMWYLVNLNTFGCFNFWEKAKTGVVEEGSTLFPQHYFKFSNIMVIFCDHLKGILGAELQNKPYFLNQGM